MGTLEGSLAICSTFLYAFNKAGVLSTVLQLMLFMTFNEKK